MRYINYFSILLFIGLLLFWELIVQVKGISELILPAPSVVVENLYRILKNGYIYPHLTATLIEVLIGFLVGTIVGLLLGVIVSQSKVMSNLLHPYIIASQAMPKLALAPLFVLWFGYGYLPKIIIVALISFFPLFESTTAGLKNIEKEKVNLFRSLQATNSQILFKLRLPASIPYIFSGLKVAIVLSVVGAVVSEFIGANKGLGALIIVGQGTMNTPLIFSAFIMLTFIGMFLYQVIEWIEKWLFKKFTYYNK